MGFQRRESSFRRSSVDSCDSVTQLQVTLLSDLLFHDSLVGAILVYLVFYNNTVQKSCFLHVLVLYSIAN